MDHVFSSLLDYFGHFDTRRAVCRAIGARGTLKKRFNELIVEINFFIHDLLEQQHLAPGVKSGTQGRPEYRACRAAKSACRAAQHLIAIFFFEFIFFRHVKPPKCA